MSQTIQIIVIAVLVMGFIYKGLPIIRRLKGAFKKLHLNPDSSLDDVRYRQLALGAIYSEQQSAYINSLNTGVPVSEIRPMLHNWWEVYDTASAKDMLGFLLDNIQHSVFPLVMAAYTKRDDTVISELTDVKKIEKARSQLSNLRVTLADLKEEGIVEDIADVERLGVDGWELGRLVYVARMCFDTGFISETEAWEFIAIVDGMAKEKFSNWKDFGYSYVIGRALWSGKDSANSGIVDIAKYLLSEPESPWVKLNW